MSTIHGAHSGSIPGVAGENYGAGGVGVHGSAFGPDGRGVAGWGAGGTGVLGETVGGTGVEGRAFDGVDLAARGTGRLHQRPTAATGAPTTGSHAMGEQLRDAAGDLWLCVADGTPGTWKRVLAQGEAVNAVGVAAPLTVAGPATAPTLGIAAASAGAAGSMSAADKAKLDGVAAGAQINVLESVSGTAPITVAPVAGKNQTIAIAPATPTAPGSLAAADKAKLDGVQAGAQVNALEDVQLAGAGGITRAVAGKTITLTTQLATAAANGLLSAADKAKLDQLAAGTGVLYLPDGTASVPGLAFSQDPDTGLFRPAADTLALATGGGERVRVNVEGLTTTGQVRATGRANAADLAADATYWGGGRQYYYTIYGPFGGDGAAYTYGGANQSNDYYRGGRVGGFFWGGNGFNYAGAGAGVFAQGGDAAQMNHQYGWRAEGGAGLFARGGLNDDGTRAPAGWFQGAAYATSWNTISSEVHKDDIGDLPAGLDALLALRPREFAFRGEARRQAGFVAEEVAAAFPGAALIEQAGAPGSAPPDQGGTPQTVVRGYDLNALVALLVRALQETAAEVAALKRRLALP